MYSKPARVEQPKRKDLQEFANFFCLSWFARQKNHDKALFSRMLTIIPFTQTAMLLDALPLHFHGKPTSLMLPKSDELIFWLLPKLRNPRAAIALLLGSALNRKIEWCVGEFGKPAVKDNALALSWSHTRSRTLLAMRDSGELGVDIEAPRGLSSAILQRCYSQAEQAICATKPEAARQIWCLKEAYVKAIGRGIAFGLGRIDCSGAQLHIANSSNADAVAEAVKRPAFAASYRLAEDYVAALVCLNEAPKTFVAIDVRQRCLELCANAQ